MVPRLTNVVLRSASPELPAAVMKDDDELIPENIKLPPSPVFELMEDEAIPIKPSEKLSPRPTTLRRVTSPELTPTITTTQLQVPTRLRTKSPASRGHLRSSSSSSTISLPLMQRAHSSPGVDSTGRYIAPAFAAPRRPSSPSGHYDRRRSPLRSAMDAAYPRAPSWSGLSIEPNIPEHAELELSSTQLTPMSTVLENDLLQAYPTASMHNTFPRSRRRPASPLQQSASAPTLHVRATSPYSTSGSNSPSFPAQRYANDSYPGYSLSSASSMPSTPTSIRSRSPSISSLETIEDTPDAEAAAMIEADEEARLKVEDGDASSGELRRRSSMELRSGSLRSNKERKRWSVCGAERRADFSLEPIEE